jgi:hypothetical protein
MATRKARNKKPQAGRQARSASRSDLPALEPRASERETPDEAVSQDLRIEEPVICRALTNPKGYAPFLQFCCGKERREELEVSLTIHNLWAGTTQTQQIAVLLEKDVEPVPHTGERPLLGVCTIATTSAGSEVAGLPGITPSDRGALVGVIGTDLACRKHTLRDGTTRPGEALLCGTLELIQGMFGGTMPFVRTHVLPVNAGSKPLFDEHRFDNLGLTRHVNMLGKEEKGDNLALFRRPGIPPAAKRPRNWSTRPPVL